jgi:hypothetical protein
VLLLLLLFHRLNGKLAIQGPRYATCGGANALLTETTA